MLLVTSNAGAFNEMHVKKLLAVNACVSCDLSGADFRDANLRGVEMSGAYFSGAVLWNANTKEAIFGKTKTPWGVNNSGCKKAK